jgi:hypothetical protein
MMLQLYLINGTGGELQDNYESKLEEHLHELRELEEQSDFSFKCSFDEEDLSPVKKTANLNQAKINKELALEEQMKKLIG